MSNVISRSRDVTRLTWREQQQLAFSVIQLELDSIGGQQHISAGAVLHKLHMPQAPNMTFFGGSNIPYIDDTIQLPFICEICGAHGIDVGQIGHLSGGIPKSC